MKSITYLCKVKFKTIYLMKTISLITLLLAKILFIMSAYVNEPILTAISVFGIIVAISIFIDDAISVKKSKKHY